MSLVEQYNLAIAKGEIKDDILQRQILVHLQQLADALVPTKHFWFKRNDKRTVQGIYLYGPVGGGKTYLMDLFYQHVGESNKLRLHFHQFMQQIDLQLRHLQGQKNPLQRIAGDLVKKARLLFLDEFLVYDIADAMILAELLQIFFALGGILVATSNTRPDDLYRDGLQRIRFLPAIELIKTHCQVLALADQRDYRLGRMPQLQAYLFPLNATTARHLTEQFEVIAGDSCVESNGDLTVQNRLIPFIKQCAHAAWFTFAVICNLPRSQLDYLELAGRFDTLFVSEIPYLAQGESTGALLLTYLIDVLYDQGVRLIISAAVPLEQLYPQEGAQQSFQRTLSRLKEMQSMDYLNRHPRR